MYPSVKDAAAAIGVSTQAIYTAKRRGRLDFVGIGRGRKKRVVTVTPRGQGDQGRKAETPVARPSALLGIFHPKWSPSDDHFILTQRDQAVAFDRIAIGLMRERVAVEQRWHRLRVVPGILELLEDYGLTNDPYPEPGAGLL